MRKKTEDRRQAILKAATEVFGQMGFEHTAMEDIRARLGCSKPTLYSYFSSKEELFVQVVMDGTEAALQKTLDCLDTTVDDIGEALHKFGWSLLTLLYSPQVGAMRRLVVSEAGRSALGRRCYELGPERALNALADFLKSAMSQGKLRQSDCHVAALHLRALLEAEWLDRYLFQTLDSLSKAQINQSVARAVAVFMAAYRAEAPTMVGRGLSDLRRLAPASQRRARKQRSG